MSKAGRREDSHENTKARKEILPDFDPKPGQRVWRLRKRHQHVDAELCDAEGNGVEIQFWLDGALTYRRRWPTRDEALAEAAGKRAELEQQGWLEHW